MRTSHDPKGSRERKAGDPHGDYAPGANRRVNDESLDDRAAQTELHRPQDRLTAGKRQHDVGADAGRGECALDLGARSRTFFAEDEWDVREFTAPQRLRTSRERVIRRHDQEKFIVGIRFDTKIEIGERAFDERDADAARLDGVRHRLGIADVNP